ncbi:trypsin-like serine peptidase [Demetria terragena]|uniref:trypsin-like serine peptidase n=1 Tax=Demetria terragena TaxID=63959 RepID=UPI0003745796|nr:trypsin-like serine protease [Demetria terragena]
MTQPIRNRRLTMLGGLLAAASLTGALVPAQAAPPEDLPIEPVGYPIVDGKTDFDNPLEVPDLTADPGYSSTSASDGSLGAARSVIGRDGRTQVTDASKSPYRRTGQLAITRPDGRPTHCTAWLVSDRTAVTAGHCVEGGTYSDLAFTPARDTEGEAPYGTFEPSEVWFDARGTGSGGDWAVLRFDESIGNTVGWYGLAPKAANAFTGQNATVIGYPADKPEGTMWQHTDVVSGATSRKVNYKTDTAGGQSGSAVTTDNQHVANAIHTNGTFDTTNGSNSGTRLTAELFNTIAQLRR